MIEILTLLVGAIALVVNVIRLIQKTIEKRSRERLARAVTRAAITVASIGVLLWIVRKS